MGGRVARVGGVVSADGVREGLVRRAWRRDWHRWTVSRSRRSSPRFVLCVSECECASVHGMGMDVCVSVVCCVLWCACCCVACGFTLLRCLTYMYI